MTDSRLQELKRAWEASGSVEDEAAYLRERVRVGDLTQERLELAAYCGHDAARLMLGNRAPDCFAMIREGTRRREKALERFCRGLSPWGKQAGVRAALAIAPIAAAKLGSTRLGEPPFVEASIAAARQWVECPSSAHRAACHSVWQRFPDSHALRRYLGIGEDFDLFFSVSPAYYLVKAASSAPHADTPTGAVARYLALKASRLAGKAAVDAYRALRSQSRDCDRVLAREIGAALKPWALRDDFGPQA